MADTQRIRMNSFEGRRVLALVRAGDLFYAHVLGLYRGLLGALSDGRFGGAVIHAHRAPRRAGKAMP
jgi:hypothetical protein